MKMNKHDPGTDMEIDMTPMIDIVFQLIIFFMLISDMTQKDLEELVLPEAQKADPDKPPPGEIRPVVNLLADGSIYIRGQKYYDPDAPDDYAKLRQHLYDMARRMDEALLDETKPAGPGNPMIPDNAVLVRADQSTPFYHIQKVMEICGQQDIQIWKIQLAASETAPEEGSPVDS